MSREQFEEWISSPPYERNVERYPDDAKNYEWPGSYRRIGVDLAWQAWKESEDRLSRLEEAARKSLSAWVLRAAAEGMNDSIRIRISELRDALAADGEGETNNAPARTVPLNDYQQLEADLDETSRLLELTTVRLSRLESAARAVVSVADKIASGDDSESIGLALYELKCVIFTTATNGEGE